MGAQHIKDPDFLLIDLFCGAGGTTTGAEMSGVCKVIAAINHDALAIKSHAANHRHVLHMTEDILVADIEPIRQAIIYWKNRYPAARLILWASLECTNFSDAKGGLPRDADSRALADGMFRYLDALGDYIDYFFIENVEEFMAWGPLVPKVVKSADGDYCPLAYRNDRPGPHLIPESRSAGRDYVRWIKQVQGYGYAHDWRLLNAANFGGVTIRERYFGAFWKKGLPFAWPQPTHAKRPSKGTLFADGLKPWRPVAEVLDFSDLGKSIFDRRRPLVDKTLRRILAGLRKFHNEPQVMVCNSPGYCQPITRPVGTLTTVNSKALVTPFLMRYNGVGIGQETNRPIGTLTTNDRFAVVAPWIDRNFRSGRSQSVTQPAVAVLTVPKLNLCSAWMMDMKFRNTGRPLNTPAPTLLTGTHHYLTSAFLVNPQYRSAGSTVKAPAPTVIAAQRSFPLSLAIPVSVGLPRWAPADTDSEAMTELKAFMREKGIADIFMRMLKIVELKRIQGFPDDYVLCGTADKRKAFIGNSVETGVVRAWLQTLSFQKQTV